MMFLSVFMFICWFYIDPSGAQVSQGMVEQHGFRSVVVQISAFTSFPPGCVNKIYFFLMVQISG
jgi:hypothetical protein